MKYKTFMIIVKSAGALAGAGLLYWTCSAEEVPPLERVGVGVGVEVPPETETPVIETKPPPVARPESKPKNATSNTEARLRALLGNLAKTPKIKDLFAGAGPKINLYAEDGVWVRAKVDLDRDDKWDEKWRWEKGVIYRKLSSADNDIYGTEAPLDIPAATITPPTNVDKPTTAAQDELREVDRFMLGLLDRPVTAKIKDASKGRRFKINLYSDDGQRFNRAKADLDRDDKWDEKWDFKTDGSITRKVSSADNDSYDQRFVLEARSRWQPVTD